MFLTVAVLTMVLGLVVNLANRLRSDALERHTRRQLRRLAVAVDRYAAQHGGQVPDVPPLIDPAAPLPRTDAALEAAMAPRAALNRDAVRRALGLPPARSPADDPLSDPWGSPLVFMPRQNPRIGMAAGDRPFFFSAGPDRQYHTPADNLYSYDDAPAADAPATEPAVGTTRP